MDVPSGRGGSSPLLCTNTNMESEKLGGEYERLGSKYFGMSHEDLIKEKEMLENSLVEDHTGDQFWSEDIKAQIETKIKSIDTVLGFEGNKLDEAA